MASKYDVQLFNFETLEGEKITIEAWTYSYTRSWGHKGHIIGSYIEKHITYYNRTWEAFKYESLLHKIVWALYPLKSDEARRAYILAQINAIAEHKRAEAEKWLNNFKSVWAGLSNKTREAIQKSGVMLETQEQAEALIKSAQLLDLVA